MESGDRDSKMMIKNLQQSVGFVGQQHGNEEDAIPGATQKPQVPPNPNLSASSQMGRNSQRQLAVTTVSKCKVGAARRQTITVQFQWVESTDYNGWYRSEINSRANTFCCSKGWVWTVIQGFKQTWWFSWSYGDSHECSSGHMSISFWPSRWPYIHLVANEALLLETMEYSLIPPAQVWNNNLVCNIVPKYCSNGKSIFGILWQPDQCASTFLPVWLHCLFTYKIAYGTWACQLWLHLSYK